MKMKVALIAPPARSNSSRIPFSLLYLASYLEKVDKENVETKIVDIKTGMYKKITKEDKEKLMDEIIDEVISFNPSVVGLTCLVTEVNEVLEIAKSIKEKLNAFVVVGGIHPTLYPQDILFEGTPVDFVVIGEGEKTFSELINAIKDNKPTKEIKGLAWFDKKLVKTECRELMEDIDALHPLPYHKVDMNYYTKVDQSKIRFLPVSSLNVFTTRGCPFNCAFCVASNLWKDSDHKKILRMRSTENVIDELRTLIEKYNIDGIYFLDETFTIDMKRIEKLCDEIIANKLKFVWACETRVNLVSEELLRKMKMAGCIQIDFGIESGSQERLNEMRKGITIEQVEKAFEMCHKVGIRPFGCFMFNLPNETIDDVKKSFNLIKKIKACFYNFAITTPFPGTDIYELVNPKLRVDEYEIFEKATRNLNEPRFRFAKHDLELTKFVSKIERRFNNPTKRLRPFLNRTYVRQILRSKRKPEYVSESFHMFEVAIGKVKQAI